MRGTRQSVGRGMVYNRIFQSSAAHNRRVYAYWKEENTRLFSDFFFQHSILSSRNDSIVFFSGTVVTMGMPKK